MLDTFRGLARRIPKIELTALLLTIIIGGGIWGFIELADEIGDEDTHHFDRAILLSMRSSQDTADPIGPLWLEEMGRDFTALGGTGILALLSLATIAYLCMMQKSRAALLVAAGVLGAAIFSNLLKLFFERDRPDLVTHLSHTATASFPSGHAMMSIATYLILGAMLARMHEGKRIKIFFLGCAILISLLVGVSRVYLGVHWPTDVLAGWALGATWAAICWLIAWWLQQRRQLEAPDA